MWWRLVGRAGPRCDLAAEQADASPNTRRPGALFADQSKAFERLSLAWYAKVLAGWGLPQWIQRGLLALVVGRAVQALVGGRPGPLRHLSRSIGMGGTASPLGWNMAYDPIVVGLGAALGVGCPTFVDDLAALVWGPGQALRAVVALMCASYAAGLAVEGHSCWTLRSAAPSREAVALFDGLPVRVWTDRDGTRAQGLSPDLLLSVLGPFAGEWRVERHPCNCQVKTALVVAGDQQAWALALEDSPFGSGLVRQVWPYLGVAVMGPAGGGGSGRWDQPALTGIARDTWERARSRLAGRARALAACTCSPGRRAAAWNTYIVTLVPYPAHVALPDAGTVRALWTCYRAALRMNGAAWCPAWALTGIGIALGVRGAPRCPVAATRATAALAWYRRETWGPAPLALGHRRCWEQALTWAAHSPPGEAPALRANMERVRATLRLAAQSALWQRDLPPNRTVGRALYVAAWARDHLAAFWAWLAGKSRTRRWASGTGREWLVLQAATNYTAGHHILRVLADGLPGSARWRSSAARHLAPRRCFGCGAPARYAWTTPAEGQDGRAWCEGCFGPSAQGDAWACLPSVGLPEPLLRTALALRASRGCPAHDDTWPASPYDKCPLCSGGEAGAEHLLSWCPAVALAWACWGRSAAATAGGHLDDLGPSLLTALLHAHGNVEYLATFVHQVAFLHSTLLGRACMTPVKAAAWLVRSCGATHSGAFAELDDTPAPESGAVVGLEPHAWAALGPDCACAGVPLPRRLWASAGPALTGVGDTGAGRMVCRPAPQEVVAAGTAVARLFASARVASWLLPGPGWWPRPRCVAPAAANAAWRVDRCTLCNEWCACRTTTSALRPGDEVLVPWNPAPAWEEANWPLEATFDGSASELVAGAGATVWAHQLGGGPPVCVARGWAAIPWPAGAQVAEAVGCRLALDMLVALQPPSRAARIVGDNLAVVRYGAGTARLRRPELQAHLEGALGRALAAGWRLQWCAVRRRLNRAADALALEGRLWAQRLLRTSTQGIQYRTEWCSGDGPLHPPQPPR